ncbi:MAG: FtsX-like permease family protein [Tannerellaceae bacterium]|nr:FtsX-like permease family protein [Tannerellaceae bacterium]
MPALNLTGVAQTTIQQRQEEIGIRKSFGATGTNILRQLIAENLIISLLGGIIGMLLSLFLLTWTKSFLFENDPMLTGEMILQPVFFITAFIFIVLLNILSIIVPAVRVSGLPIVNVLKGSNNKK